ncbi:hypothetical protein KAR91_12755 [Candidatus Pacearchaeota archaeon]|nr:hypothetical protein [Candidatus Pacearchaeota archaeon]
MKKTTDLVVQPTPMKKGDRAKHVLTGEIVMVRQVNHGLVQSYWVQGRTEMFRAAEMELIRLPKGK